MSTGGTNAEAAATGELRKALEALRDTLAGDLDACESNVRAQIASQYRQVLADIAALPPVDGVAKSKRDELKERRERNHGTAPAGASTPPAAGAASPARRKRGA